MKSVLIPFVVGLFSLNFLVLRNDVMVQRIAEVESTISHLHEVQGIDQQRQRLHLKIDRIISRFNPEMPQNMRTQVADVIYEMSVKYPNLDMDLICATITHESGRSWNPKVLSSAGAMGLMQIMPSTGKWLARFDDIEWTSAEEILHNPVYNIRMGTRYLSTLIELYGLEGGLAAYNGGGTIAKRWLASGKAEGVLWDETRSYIPFVLKLYKEFREMMI